jgi:hypothetical protein
LSDIFREIDEELRRHNLQQLWNRYSSYIIALAVVVVLCTAGVMGWRAYQLNQRQAEGVRYAAALDLSRQGKNAEASDAFSSLAQTSSSGRVALARLEAAASKAKANDIPGAIAIYDQLAADTKADSIFRDAATLLSARYGLETADPQATIAKLQPLTNAANPWHGMAAEMTAITELKSGDKAKAKSDFEALAKDNAVSQGVRQRAAEMAETIAP